MQKHAVVFFPKIDTIGRIQDFREKYDTQYRVLAPHITLVFPFADIPEEQITKHIALIAQTTQPFKIHLKGLQKSFDHYLFFLVKEGKDAVEVLHDRLYSGILSSYLSTEIPFIPHITLGSFANKENKLDTEAFAKANKEAEGLGLDMWCNFDSVSLIQGDGISPARTIRNFPLNI